jgi:hypothetical protein
LCNLHEIAQWTGAIDRETQQLWQLTDQHCERNAIHISVADRFREEFGNEPKAQRAYQNAHQARDQRHYARKSHCTHGIATRER